MNRNKVRVAIIGLGIWGESHVEAYASLPQAEVVAVCDTRADRLNAVADRFGIADRYASAATLWQRDDIDLVSVVTVETEHLEPVLGALKSGKHVLVEKPVSTKLAEAQAMQAAAEENNRFLMPGHILRFDPRYAEVQRAIQENRIGQVVSVYSKRARPKSLLAIYGRVHTVFVTMAHDIDLALWYTGSRVRSVRAYERYVTGSSAPDLVWACLEFESGALAVLQSSWLVPDAAHVGMADRAEVIGDKGMLSVDPSSSGFEWWSDAGRHSPDLLIHNQVAGRAVGALQNQLRYLCDCILAGEAPTYIPFADAIHGLEAAEAVVRSAKTEEEVHL